MSELTSDEQVGRALKELESLPTIHAGVEISPTRDSIEKARNLLRKAVSNE